MNKKSIKKYLKTLLLYFGIGAIIGFMMSWLNFSEILVLENIKISTVVEIISKTFAHGMIIGGLLLTIIADHILYKQSKRINGNSNYSRGFL